MKMIRTDSRTLQATVTFEDAPYNLTGHKIWFTAKKQYSDADVLAVIRKGNTAPLSGITVDIPTGVITVEIDPSDTSGLPGRETTDLYWDLQIQTTAGKIRTIAKGLMTVECDVTQALS